MNTGQKKTLALIFKKPTRADLRYDDVTSLLIAAGASIQEGRGSRVRFGRGCVQRSSPCTASEKGSAQIFSRISQGFSDTNWSKTMKNTMKYKGYSGSVAFDAEDRIFHGRVLGVSSALIGFCLLYTSPSPRDG